MPSGNVRSDLKFKERSLVDLARFISTRAENTPNYTLLLGAGCSVTSGIRSAASLINEWRREVISPLISDCAKPTDSAISEFLAKNSLPWYDRSREYSCLFERRFDLQPQRRMFVENEVANKKPSIGYAYLAALINQNYFNTVFTTNFDDLLNEAFFQFSDLRPVICAHDSSINGVTVTSKRPKVIKLHGDYLFDDIKSTTRETESLEQNMRLKFSEFAKDSGLIVVGYAGNDRSVMDVLSSLLRSEEYFKKGIYWCLRSDSEISEDLRKLLWKDRVYFVNIDGFDELFGELYAKFNNGDVVPISTRKVSNRTHEIIRTLIDGKDLDKSPSPILREAHATLSKESTTNALYSLIRKAKEEEKQIDRSSLKDDELLVLFEASNLIEQGKYAQAIELCRERLSLFTRTPAKVALLRTITRAQRYSGDQVSAIAAIDEVIALEPYSATHHLSKLPFLRAIEDKERVISQAMTANPYHHLVYWEKAKLLSRKLEDTYGDEKKQLLATMEEQIEIGLQRDPSASNPCWMEKFNLIEIQAKKPEVYGLRLALIEQLSQQSPRSINVLQMRSAMMNPDTPAAEANLLLEDIGDVIKRWGEEFHSELEALKLETLSNLDRWHELRVAIDGKIHRIEENFDFAVCVADLERKKFRNDQVAIDILRKVVTEEKGLAAAAPLTQALIETGQISEAEKLIAKWANRFDQTTKETLRFDLLCEKPDFDAALTELESAEKFTGAVSTNKSYLLLKKGCFDLVEKMLREKLEQINFSLEADVEIINYEVSKKLQGKKINDRRINELLKFHGSSSRILVAGNALLGNKEGVVEKMKEVLQADQTARFSMRAWPVLVPYANDPRIQSLLEHGVDRLHLPPVSLLQSNAVDRQSA